MNEPSKNKSSRLIPRSLLLWLIFFTAIGVMTSVADLVQSKDGIRELPSLLSQVFVCTLFASVLLGLWLFIRWLNCWRNFRRALVGAAILATLIAVFYAEEDWRGKRAWQNCKRELEAKGVVLDWDKFIPPPVPDDQNFFKTSKKIAASFVHSRNYGEAESFSEQERIQFGLTASNAFTVFDNTKSKPLVVAQLTILTPDVKLAFANTNSVFKLNDPAASDQIGKLIQKIVGQSASGSQGFRFSEIQFSNLVPAQIFVEADSAPSVSDLENFIPPDTATNIGRLQIEPTIDKGIFQVVLADVHITSAADYLKWSGQYESDFNEIRAALKRPYARIDCDYSQPYSMAVPNFVTMRALAQTLAQRTQCYLLLGQPAKALGELALLNDSRHLLEGAPTGKPMTLVAAMINVAVTGLYVNTIADGLKSHAWQEPQLASLEEQLSRLDLIPFVSESFREMPAHDCRFVEQLEAANRIDKQRLGTLLGIPRSWTWKNLADSEFLLFNVAPKGWLDQNLITVVEANEKILDAMDASNAAIFPKKINTAMRETENVINNHSVYGVLASTSIPNYSKAFQTLAYNQTLVNEAQIVCALERYHLAHGDYPETLDALMPQFMEKIPHDIIGGQPLHYRRTDDGKFLLYSVGWNETDDGGLPGTLSDVKNGDWVWKN
jgi:hypothetical protein